MHGRSRESSQTEWRGIAAAWAGDLAYAPGLIGAPLAIIRGAWDSLITDTDARWLFEALRVSPIKRDVKISRATHLMHLEESRYQLYREAQCFLEDEDTPRTRSFSSFSAVSSRVGLEQHPQRGKVMTDPTKTKQKISGYTYGSDEVAKSPITLEEWETLKKSALFSEEDVFYLRLSHDVLVDHVDELLATWRGIIFDHPHLRAYDEDPKTGEVDTAYTAAVGKRFGQWVLDTAKAQYDQAWLDYQYEIGLRHHRTKKNQTDHGHTLGHVGSPGTELEFAL